MTSLRIFFVGGLTSYRALFNWLTPWILIPSFLIAPLFQILLFAYIGRTAHLESDRFYVIGNALQYAAVPCLFAMGNTIGGERYQHTLSLVLTTPAGRLPLFIGRSLHQGCDFGVDFFLLLAVARLDVLGIKNHVDNATRFRQRDDHFVSQIARHIGNRATS